MFSRISLTMAKTTSGVVPAAQRPFIRFLDGRAVRNGSENGMPSSRMSVPPSISARAIRIQVSLSGSPATVNPMKRRRPAVLEGFS